MKRILNVLVIVGLLVGLVPNIGYADPSVEVEDGKLITVSKLRSYENALQNTYKGKYGLLYNLYYLTLYAHWVDFVYNNTYIVFGTSEKSSYREDLMDKIRDFNTRFGSDSSSEYLPLTLTVSSTADSFKTVITSLLNDKAPTYVSQTLTDILESIQEDRSLEAEIIEENKEILRYSYRILDALINEKLEMTKLMPSSSNGLEYMADVTFSEKAAEVFSKEEFQDLIQAGRSLTEEEQTELGSVSYTELPTFIEQLAYVRTAGSTSSGAFGEDLFEPLEGYEGDDGEVKLRDTYIAMIAATGIYRPFQSYVGDQDYMDALEFIVGEENAENIANLFNNIKDYRKPLYTIEDAGWWESTFGDATEDEASFPTYSGKGKPLTIKNFLERIEDETVSGFVTMKGDFKRVKDDVNQWAFFRSSEGLSAGFGGSNTSVVFDTTDEEDSSTDESTTTEVSNSQGSIIAIAGQEVNSTEWTSSLFEFGYEDGYPITGLALMKNYIQKIGDIDSIENKSSRFLFINAIGDIVTDDNMVVIPAAANPMIYDDTLGYNPYTVAFMNGYPTVYVSGTDRLTIGNANDVGKYLLMGESDSIGDKHVFIPIQGESNLEVTHAKQPMRIFKDFYNPTSTGNTSSILSITNAQIPGWLDSTIGSFIVDGWDYMKAYQISLYHTQNYAPIFPYDKATDTDGSLAKTIVRNLYWSYKNSNDEITGSFNGRLKEDFIFRNILVSGLGGSIYALSYTKNIVESYENILDDGYRGITKIFVNFTKEVMENFGDQDGVLGLKDRYQDPLLGKVITWLEDYMLIGLTILGLILLVSYMRQRLSLLYSLFMIVLVLSVAFMFVKVIPVYLPKVYNMVVSDVSKNLSYHILTTKSEKYDKTYGQSGQIGEDGRFKINTTSVNLFRLSDSHMKEISDRYQVSLRDLKTGGVFMLDTRSGLYIEGDSIKLNADLLFSTNPIVGEYVESNETGLYQYESQKMYSSVIDYYTPYFLIVDGFIDTLNNLLTVYTIPRNTTSYIEGLDKDSYIVYNYINSLPFLSPDDMTKLSDEVSIKDYERLNEAFPLPYDFLGLDNILSNPTEAMKESLWYRTLQQNGILDDTEEGEEKYWNFIASVNYITKKFIIDIKPQVGMISDENLIKTIALQATTIFSQKASQFFNYMYPVSLNYQEFSLSDVYLASFTDDYSRFLAADMDVVDYVANVSGIPGLIALMIDIFFGAIVALVIKSSVPILYLIFAILVIVKFVAGRELRSAMVGYAKISALVFGCLTASVLMLGFVSKMSASWWSLYLLAFVYSLILFIMFNILSSVLFNISEMGNSKLNANFKAMADSLRVTNILDNIKSLKVKTTEVYREYNNSGADSMSINTTRYSNDTNVDDFIDDLVISDVSRDRTLVRRPVYRSDTTLTQEEVLNVDKSKGIDELDNYKV